MNIFLKFKIVCIIFSIYHAQCSIHIVSLNRLWMKISRTTHGHGSTKREQQQEAAHNNPGHSTGHSQNKAKKASDLPHIHSSEVQFILGVNRIEHQYHRIHIYCISIYSKCGTIRHQIHMDLNVRILYYRMRQLDTTLS